MTRIAFETVLEIWHSPENGSAGGYVRIAGEAADAIRVAAITGQWMNGGKRHFGSAKVTSTIGATTWANSVFPEKGSESWFMPIKLAVRKAEGLSEGDRVAITVEL